MSGGAKLLAEGFTVKAQDNAEALLRFGVHPSLWGFAMCLGEALSLRGTAWRLPLDLRGDVVWTPTTQHPLEFGRVLIPR